MVHHPKTLPADASVDDVRAELTDDHVHMVLLVEGKHLRGTVVRDDLETGLDGRRPAADLARLDGRTLPPTMPAEDARRWLVARGQRRAAVVDADGRLLGLLCLKASGTGFCSDDDVRGRAAGPRP
jgi:CBS domain-containing protein